MRPSDPPHRYLGIGPGAALDFQWFRISDLFVRAVHSRLWPTVHGVLDYLEGQGIKDLPLHPQATRHAEADRCLRFIVQAACSIDEISIIDRLHQRARDAGLRSEERFFVHVASFGRKDPELDKTFARLCPTVRAWLAGQRSLGAIRRVSLPHRILPRVPLPGHRA